MQHLLLLPLSHVYMYACVAGSVGDCQAVKKRRSCGQTHCTVVSTAHNQTNRCPVAALTHAAAVRVPVLAASRGEQAPHVVCACGVCGLSCSGLLTHHFRACPSCSVTSSCLLRFVAHFRPPALHAYLTCRLSSNSVVGREVGQRNDKQQSGTAVTVCSTLRRHTNSDTHDTQQPL